ncbi:hypothetical protein SKAU_G00041630 [Synaphobranchus kaupii]|uniref:Uncharacterized protein n=1 Tax=Synaphobranchus kaupii TaxID=118154 RepID=A0A9Q1G161_SYNKA|nr:hypothetical protein SKAU_G00041630 [Synaphobranchus kaupii]
MTTPCIAMVTMDITPGNRRQQEGFSSRDAPQNQPDSQVTLAPPPSAPRILNSTHVTAPTVRCMLMCAVPPPLNAPSSEIKMQETHPPAELQIWDAWSQHTAAAAAQKHLQA